MSALPKLFSPEEELDPTNVRALQRAVDEGRACVECGEEWATEHAKSPVICTVCANRYLTNLLDQLGYTVRRDRSKNAEAHAARARQSRNG